VLSPVYNSYGESLMSLPLGEAVISSGPTSVDGVRNEFLDIIVEMLRDADIQARLASLDDIGPENQPAWVSRGDFEPCFVLVRESDVERARHVLQKAEDCRICLECEAWIKPGLTKCPKCGVADERDPAELHAAYNAALLRHLSEK
jgi:ribosomal protein L40E